MCVCVCVCVCVCACVCVCEGVITNHFFFSFCFVVAKFGSIKSSLKIQPHESYEIKLLGLFRKHLSYQLFFNTFTARSHLKPVSQHCLFVLLFVKIFISKDTLMLYHWKVVYFFTDHSHIYIFVSL